VSLRQEIAALHGLASETKSLKTQLAKAESENERLASENKTLKNVQNEVKTLQAKLVAARSHTESAANAKGQPGARATGKGAKDPANGLDDAQIMKLKEDLYCDLTGLMIHGVKRVDGEDVFDCIQTGKNGSEYLASFSCVLSLTYQHYASTSRSRTPRHHRVTNLLRCSTTQCLTRRTISACSAFWRTS
jgi:hypothetical protein